MDLLLRLRTMVTPRSGWIEGCPWRASFTPSAGPTTSKNRERLEAAAASTRTASRDLYVITAFRTTGSNFVQGTLIEGNAEGHDGACSRKKGRGRRDDLRLSRNDRSELRCSQPAAAPAQVPATVCKVLDVFGNTLYAQAVEMARARGEGDDRVRGGGQLPASPPRMSPNSIAAATATSRTCPTSRRRSRPRNCPPTKRARRST